MQVLRWCLSNRVELIFVGGFAVMAFVGWAYKKDMERVQAGQIVANELIERLGMDTTAENLSVTAIAERLRQLDIDIRKK